MLYKAWEKVLNLFDDHSTVVSEGRHASFQGKGIKILTPRQMLQRLLIAVAQVKAGKMKSMKSVK